MTDDELRGGARAIHGRVPASEPWIPVRDLNNGGAQALSRGDVAVGVRMLREALALTDGVADIEARELRSRALLNLANAHGDRGEVVEALALIDESLALTADVIDEIGDERGTHAVRANAMVLRAQTLSQSAHIDEALEQADAAQAMIDTHDGIDAAPLMRFQLAHVRSTLLMAAGRVQEAEGEARRALELALPVDPALAVHPYLTLASVAHRTGDADAARELVELAAGLQADGDDVMARQVTTESRARLALEQQRFDEAAELFREAAALADQAGLHTRASASRLGAAAVYLQSGNPVIAARALRKMIAELGEDGAVADRRDAYGYLGDAESRRGRFSAADEAYRQARALSRSPYEMCRVDLRRAEMHAEWASATPLPGRRMARLRMALETAVPVLLATEALRGGFAPGPTRERWSLQVAAPARELAFRLAVLLGENALVFELVENAAASATLQIESIETGEVVEDAGVVAPVIDLFGAVDEPAEELPAAASGFAGDVSSIPVRFAPPPRVVALPGAEPVLEKWVRIAEAEYGVPVRGDQVVAAW